MRRGDEETLEEQERIKGKPEGSVKIGAVFVGFYHGRKIGNWVQMIHVEVGSVRVGPILDVLISSIQVVGFFA